MSQNNLLDEIEDKFEKKNSCQNNKENEYLIKEITSLFSNIKENQKKRFI